MSFRDEIDEKIFKKRGGLLNFRQQIARQVPAPGKLARRRSILISTNGGRQGPSFRRFCSNLQVAAFPTLVRSVRRGSSWVRDQPMVANDADVARGYLEQLWRAAQDFKLFTHLICLLFTMHTCICMHTYIHTFFLGGGHYVHVHMHTYIHTYIHVCIYVYIYSTM